MQFGSPEILSINYDDSDGSSDEEEMESSTSRNIRDPLDVGFIDTSGNEENPAAKFELAFLLKPYYWRTMKTRSRNLFGRIIDGQEVIDGLTQTRKFQRDGFSVTIESRRNTL